jgi:hypothetical protein
MLRSTVAEAVIAAPADWVKSIAAVAARGRDFSI